MLKKFKFVNCISKKIQPRDITPCKNIIESKNKCCHHFSGFNYKSYGNSFVNFSKKYFTFSLPDEENNHTSNIRNRPNRLIDLNLKKSAHSFIIKMNLPFNDETQIVIFNKLMKNQNIDIIADKIKFEVLLKIILISNYCTGNAVYFIVDEDEEAKQIINLLNNLELDLVLIKDDSQSELFNTQITNRFLINYKNFKKIPKFRENSLLVFLTENRKNLANWIDCEEFKNHFQKSNMFVLNKSGDESVMIQNILKKFNLKNLSLVKNLTEKQTEVLFNFGINHFAMCAQKRNISIICKENCKKFLRLGKKILIICENEQSRHELLQELADIEGYIKQENVSSINSNPKATKTQGVFKTNLSENLSNKSGLVRIGLSSEILKNKDELEKYDVIIEYPFVSIETFIDRRKYLRKLKWGDVFMISLYLEKESQLVEELRKMNIAVVCVRNLLSTAWLYDNCDGKNGSRIDPVQSETNPTANKLKSNSFVLKNSEQKQAMKKEVTNISLNSPSPPIPNLEFLEKIEKFFNSEKKLPSFLTDTQNTESVDLEQLYTKVEKNKYLQKQIFNTFMRQNFKKFFNFDYESISLITGEPGWYTIRIICKTPKQMEERYYVIKFLIQQGICTMDYEDKVFRVFESFDHVLDIPCEKYKDIKKNSEIPNLEVEILNELPIIHRNELADLIRHKNKFEEKLKEDLDKTQ